MEQVGQVAIPVNLQDCLSIQFNTLRWPQLDEKGSDMDVAIERSARHLSAFRALVGDRYVLDGADETSPYLRDWTGDYDSSPLAVVMPDRTDQVSAILRYCHDSGLSVVPQGGNTGLVGGCFTDDATHTIILNTKRMNRVRKLDAENFTIDVEAGCIIQDVQEISKAASRLFPLSFGAQGSAQIGGAVATNAGGLNVLRHGMVRDLILGLEVVLADGSVLDCNSSLRKDNRGLDLKQLFIGSEGSLGIVTAATFKLLPYPHDKETALLALASVDDVVTLYNLAREHCADLLSAFELIPHKCLQLALEHRTSLRSPIADPHDVYVLMELSASGSLDLRRVLESLLEKAVERGLVLDGALAESGAQSDAMWAIREAMVEAQAARGRHLRTDISVPVSMLPDFVHGADKAVAATAPDWTAIAYGHVGDGNVHFNVLPPRGTDDAAIGDTIPRVLQAIYAVLDRFDGSISAEHGVGRSRRADFEQRQDAVAQLLGQSLKALIDPKGTLNDGCLFPPHRDRPDRLP